MQGRFDLGEEHAEVYSCPVLGLALAACGEPKPVAAKLHPDNFLSIVITDDGRVNVPTQEIFIEGAATLLRLNIQSRGGNMIVDGKMFMKVVTVVSINRTDQTSNMSLGSLQMIRIADNTYGGTLHLRLPHGTYGLMIDGETTEAVIKVLPKPSAPSATTR